MDVRRDQRLITLRELSTQTGISASTLRRWVGHGRIPAIQPGGPRGKLFFLPDVLQQIFQPTLPSAVAHAGGGLPDPSYKPLAGPRPKWLHGG